MRSHHLLCSLRKCVAVGGFLCLSLRFLISSPDMVISLFIPWLVRIVCPGGGHDGANLRSHTRQFCSYSSSASIHTSAHTSAYTSFLPLTARSFLNLYKFSWFFVFTMLYYTQDIWCLCFYATFGNRVFSKTHQDPGTRCLWPYQP